MCMMQGAEDDVAHNHPQPSESGLHAEDKSNRPNYFLIYSVYFPYTAIKEESRGTFFNGFRSLLIIFNVSFFSLQ